MAIDSRQAVADLRQKLLLERELLLDLQDLNKQIVKDYIRKLASENNLPDATVYNDIVGQILRNHYTRVQEGFSTNISSRLPEEAKATPQEKGAIASALGVFFITRAPEQTAIINDTTQKNMNSAFIEATATTQQTALDTGQPVSINELAVIAGAFLARKLAGRAPAIALTETQAVAEASKATESSVLVGLQPAVTSTSSRTVPVPKEWVTVGDEVVRPAHREADRQERQLGSSYVVGGQQLRWPGDTSLGASLDNVMNCRCASIHDEDEILSIRLQPGFDEFTET